MTSLVMPAMIAGSPAPAGAGVLVGGGEPVPVAAVVCRARLLWVGDEENVLLGELVHASAGREVSAVLLTPVKHDHKWNGFAGIARRHVDVVAACPGGVGIGEVANLATRRRGCARRSATTRRSCAAGESRLAERAPVNRRQPTPATVARGTCHARSR